MNLCGIFYNVFDYLQNWLNFENLFISVALALGKMLRRSSVFVVFFFFFHFQLKTKQNLKEAESCYSHSYL